MHPWYLYRLDCIWAPVAAVRYWRAAGSIAGSGQCWTALGQSRSPSYADSHQKNDRCPHRTEQQKSHLRALWLIPVGGQAHELVADHAGCCGARTRI